MKRRVLGETTPFHPLFQKKRKALNDAVLNGTVGLLLPLHTQRQGKKNCLPLHLPLSSFLRKNLKRR
jgi:hypothetical protein